MFFLITSFVFSNEVTLPFSKWWEPAGLELFRTAYPDLKFISSYDTEKNDWIIHIQKKVKGNKRAETALFWCDSRFLPESRLTEKEKYRRMIYKYEIEVPDPQYFTEEYIKLIKEFTSSEKRSNGAIDPPFLYNFIYDCEDRNHLEEHIEKISFLGKTLNVHERIVEPLIRVEAKINLLERTEELKKFLSTLDRIDCYNWRTVRDTENRSFHSLGLAIDVLPKGYYQKSIYWGWQRQWDPEYWWKTSLSKRWMPPKRVIEIFREEGFIWGGTWIVWDNMHFEYRPELLCGINLF